MELTTIKVNDVGGFLEEWQREAEIIRTEKNCMVRFTITPRKSGTTQHFFLRQARDAGDNHFWDTFGDDYGTPEKAMHALLRAPSPLSHYIAKKMLLVAV